ncbi:hypothetical protein JCM11251_005716 [Rhodosporidiobolus azoricus]
MVLDTVYICRHGFRLSWETTIWKSPTGIPRDPPLSSHGVDQAKELAAFLREELGLKEGTREEAEREGVFILSSPLYRCIQTATPTADALDLPIFIEPGMGEWYLPVRRGLHPALASPSFLQQFFPRVSSGPAISSSPLSTPWNALVHPPRTGESIRALHARSSSLLQQLIPALEARGVKKLICFSHAATVIALARAFAGDLDVPGLLEGEAAEAGKEERLGEWKDEERLGVRAATCSVSKFVREGQAEEREKGLGKWKREWDGRTDFLERGEERRWDFTFVEEIAEDGILEDGTEVAPLKSDNYKEAPTAAPKETEASEERTKEQREEVQGQVQPGKL